MYVTLKLDDSGCRIHSVSDGNEEIVTNERYVVMPWKMVTRRGENMTLKEAVEEIKAHAKALSLFLIHSFTPFSSLGAPPDVAPALPPGNNASTSAQMAIPIAVSMEAIVIPCSLNRVRIFSSNEVSLSNTLAIVSLKLVIWFFSLPFRRLMNSCLVASSSFRSSIHLVMSSLIASS